MPLPQKEQQEYQKGADAHDEGRFAEALQRFNTLISQFPDEAKLHFALGLTWDKMGKQQRAILYLEKAADLSFDFPNNSNPYVKIADMVSLDANNKGRRPWLKKALDWAIASKSPLQIAEARYHWAVAEDNVQDSLRYVKEALTYAPNDLDLLTYLSAMLLTKGEAEAARKALQDALDKNIAGFRIYYAQALNYRALHREAEAMASLEKAVFGPDVIRIERTKYYSIACSLLTRYYLRKRRFRNVWKVAQQTVALRSRLEQEAKLADLRT